VEKKIQIFFFFAIKMAGMSVFWKEKDFSFLA